MDVVISAIRGISLAANFRGVNGNKWLILGGFFVALTCAVKNCT